MSTNARFDAALPAPYKENWREASRPDANESPRMASYQAPGGGAIPFIQKSFRFSGGQSRDTAEYPFGGLWSNEYLNEKPQSLTVEGYLRGPAYISRRNALIEALRVPTDDDNPGYIDLPFWGRFPVVVGDNYGVSEDSDERGQCALSITFTRAGISVTARAGGGVTGNTGSGVAARAGSGVSGNAGGGNAARADAPSPDEAAFEDAAADLEAAAADDFEAKLPEDKPDKDTLVSCFGRLKTRLLGILGRIQGAQTALNAMTAEVLGITSLINRGVLLPRLLAQSLFNAASSIAGGILEIRNSIALYGRTSGTASSRGKPSLPLPDNGKNVLLAFLSDDAGALSGEDDTAAAIDNPCRTTAFLVSARIIVNMDSLTRKKAEGYWRLLEKLERGIDQENPRLYAAVRDLRTALSRELSRRTLSAEMIRNVSASAPLLYLAHYLGCDEDKLRELNSIADSFVIEGDIVYV
jgi:hypothetical protein